MWKKLIVSFGFVLIIPIVIAVLLMFSLRTTLLNNAVTQAQNNTERVSLSIKELLSSSYNVSSKIAYDSTLISTLTKTYVTEYDMIYSLWHYADLSQYTNVYQNYLDGLKMYVNSRPVLSTGYIKNPPPDIKNSDWYKKILENKSLPFWQYVKNDSFEHQGTKNLSLCRPIYADDKLFSVLVAYVNNETLQNIMKQKNFTTLLCTSDDLIVAASSPKYIGESINKYGLRVSSPRLPDSIEINGKTTRVISDRINIDGTDGTLTVITLFTVNDILSSTDHVLSFAVTIVVVGSLVSICAIFIISRFLTRRLARLSMEIHKASEGNFDFISDVEGKDEIGQLAGDFNYLLSSIKALITEVYETKIQKQQLENKQKEIQLEVLNSQINPHFLFNSLETVRMMAVVKKENDIASIVKMLSMILRSSLYSGSSPIPLTKELEVVKNYLEIQKYRYSSSLEYDINILTDISSVKVIPFIVQPIVENAIKHGIENIEIENFKGFVEVSVNIENNNFIIRVVDNGKGMPSEMLENIQSNLTNGSDNFTREHIGILNVNERIKLVYGAKYGIHIASVKDKGTIVTICLPNG